MSTQATINSISELKQSIHTVFSNNFLPILDYLSQVFLPLQVFGLLQIFICLLQIFQTSFWVINGDLWGNSKVITIFNYITFFTSNTTIYSESIIVFGITFSLVLIITIIFLVLVLQYKKTKRIIRPFLSIVRLYFKFFGAAILHPMGSLIGHLLCQYIEDHEIKNFIFLIFITIAFVIAECLFYCFQKFVNQSLYIHKSVWMTFDSKFILFLFMVDPFFLIFSFLFKYYPKWSFYILIIFHILMLLLSFSDYIWMSNIVELGNILTFSLLPSIIFNDIFRIFSEIFEINSNIYISVCYVLFIILTIIFCFVVKQISKNINIKLSYSNLLNIILKPYEPTLEEKMDYFTQLKLNNNINKALTYLLVGFANGSDMFADFSYVLFCFENYGERPKMLIVLIRLLSYFKAEKNLLDQVLKQYILTGDNSYYGSFIYLQANRVKIFRQVTTNITTIRLNDIKLKSKDLENQMRSFWSLSEANANLLESLDSKQRYLKNLWIESIEDNWSSVTFREVHINFLIEACTDFQSAVQMEILKEKIDIMREERDDLCFLSLLTCYPVYFHDQIIDNNGNFIRPSKKVIDSNSSINTISSSNQDDKNISSSNESDFTFDEQVANSMISYGKLRLSMQNALNYAKPKYDKLLVIYTIFSIVVSLIILIAYFAIYIGKFNTFNDWNQEVGVLIELRIAYVKSFLCLSIYFGKESNRFHLDDIRCNKSDEKNNYFFDDSILFNKLALIYINQARDYYNDLVSAILQLSLQKVDITPLTDLLFELSIKSNICFYNEVIDTINWSMDQVLNFEILSFGILADNTNEEVLNWYNNNSYWCHDITTFSDVQNMFNEIQNALAFDLSNTSFDTSKNTLLQMIIIGPCNFLIFIIPIPIIIFLYSKEIKYLIKTMLSVAQEYKDQARKNISLTENTNETNEISCTISKIPFNWKFAILSIFIALFFCGCVLFEETILYSAVALSDKLTNLGFWSCYFSLLRSYCIEMLIEIMNGVYTYNYPNSFMKTSDFKNRIYKILRDLSNVIYEIMNDTPKCPSLIGFDDMIDELVLSKVCDNPNMFTNFHDIYQCASLNRHLSTIHSFAVRIAEQLDSYNGVFAGEDLSNFYHNIFLHTISKINDIGDRYVSLQQEEITKYKINIFCYFLGGLIFLIFYSILMAMIISFYRRIFNMAICLIRRLSPVDLVNSSELINYLLFKKNEEIETGITHTIFNNSFDGIICLNVDGIVEIINKTFVNDYGYSTEQLVGQPILNIFDDESRSKIENQLKLMKNHESRDYGEQLICFTNNGRKVPSFVSLFAMKEDENNLILVIRDETILLQKKKKLEMEKKKSQDLLEQIMPPKVLMMLKEGKNEISFAVPSATVMFVDIVNFSQFSTDLSPQQIMGTLSTLFGAFDIWIQRFPLMTKIKLIGDTYMAACGLFAVENEPKDHAKQAIDFGLKVLDILDDTNIKLNASLQIRIGVNTDGPLIAGVLGTENRVFDIIGDTINVASRLEHKSEPGHILMSEKTYDLVKDLGYNIIAIGNVFLKGKGDMPAYSI